MTLGPLPITFAHYTPDRHLDGTFDRIAHRYGIDLAVLAGANPQLRPGTIAAGASVADVPLIAIPVPTALRAFAYDSYRNPIANRTLADLVEFLRRDPRRPIAGLDARWLWNHPYHAQWRREIVTRLHPGLADDAPAIRRLDHHPEEVPVPAGTTWWFAFPERPEDAAARVAANAPARVVVDPSWVPRMEAKVASLRAMIDVYMQRAQAYEAIEQDASTVLAWAVRLSGVLGVLEAVNREGGHGDGLSPLRRAVNGVVQAARRIAGPATVRHLAAAQYDARGGEAEILWAEVHDAPFRDDTITMLRTAPTEHRELKARHAVVLMYAYYAIANEDSTAARFARELDDVVPRIATMSYAQANGESALDAVLRVADAGGGDDAHVDPAARSVPDVLGEMSAARVRATWLTTWAAPMTGNLPGPPSVTGAILNLAARRVIPELGERPELGRAACIAIVRATARLVRMSERDRALLETLVTRSGWVGPDQRTALRARLASAQTGRSWTSLYGAFAVLQLATTLMSPPDDTGRSADPATAIWEMQLVGGTAGTLSALFQRIGAMEHLGATAAEQAGQAAGVLGKAAAWINTAIALVRFGQAVEVNVGSQGQNTTQVVSTGIALVAGIAAFSEIALVAAVGVVGSIFGSMAYEAIVDFHERIEPPGRYFQLAAAGFEGRADSGTDPLGRTLRRLRAVHGEDEIVGAVRSVRENLRNVVQDLPFPMLDRTIHIDGRALTVRAALRLFHVSSPEELALLIPAGAPPGAPPLAPSR